MYDPDAAYTAPLRLTLIREAKDPIKERSDILAQIKTLWLRHCELTMQIDAEQRQSRPIPASEAVLSDDSDFWTHRHRTMGGNSALIARVNGTIERP